MKQSHVFKLEHCVVVPFGIGANRHLENNPDVLAVHDFTAHHEIMELPESTVAARATQ